MCRKCSYKKSKSGSSRGYSRSIFDNCKSCHEPPRSKSPKHRPPKPEPQHGFCASQPKTVNGTAVVDINQTKKVKVHVPYEIEICDPACKDGPQFKLKEACKIKGVAEGEVTFTVTGRLEGGVLVPVKIRPTAPCPK